MNYDPWKHHRRSIRLKGYDYTLPGAYFITLCVHKRESLFGEIRDQVMRLNRYGEMVQRCWLDLPNHYYPVSLDAFVIMPNHLHGILTLIDDLFLPNRPTDSIRHDLPEIIRSFKTFSAKRINRLRGTSGIPVWQRDYYEHIVRNDSEMTAIRDYIHLNPLHWELDPDAIIS